MRPTGLRTQKNEASVPGTGIYSVERAADIPEDDPGSMGKSWW